MSTQIPFDKVPIKNISVSFTWDDNSLCHISIIAPLFLKSQFRCTFYIVPGDKKFESLYCSGYAELKEKGFEIGSHSYSHKYMTSLSTEEAKTELYKSIEKIIKCTKHYPLTFAFPHHDYDDILIDIAKEYHLETRNTLINSTRFSIKTNSSLQDLIDAIEQAIANKTNIVLSGHSIITDDEYFNNESGEGYEPMRLSTLSGILQYLKTITSRADVTTFFQAALREFIKRKSVIENEELSIASEDLLLLKKFGITEENIISLL